MIPRPVFKPNFDPTPKQSWRFPWPRRPASPYQPLEAVGGPTDSQGDVRNGPPPVRGCDRPPIFLRRKPIVLTPPPRSLDRPR